LGRMGCLKAKTAKSHNRNPRWRASGELTNEEPKPNMEHTHRNGRDRILAIEILPNFDYPWTGLTGHIEISARPVITWSTPDGPRRVIYASYAFDAAVEVIRRAIRSTKHLPYTPPAPIGADPLHGKRIIAGSKNRLLADGEVVSDKMPGSWLECEIQIPAYWGGVISASEDDENLLWVFWDDAPDGRFMGITPIPRGDSAEYVESPPF